MCSGSLKALAVAASLSPARPARASCGSAPIPTTSRSPTRSRRASRTSIVNLVAAGPRRHRRLHLARAAPRLPARDAEGRRLRSRARPAEPVRRRAHDRALLPFDLRVRHAPGRPAPSAPSTIRSPARSSGRRAARRRRRLEHPARACARAARHRRQHSRLHALWRLSRAEPAGAHRRRGGDGRDRHRRRLGAARRLFRDARAGPLRVTPVQPRARGAAASHGLGHLPWRVRVGRRCASAREIDGALERRRAEVDAILAAYGVPRIDRQAPAPEVRHEARVLILVACAAARRLRAREARGALRPDRRPRRTEKIALVRLSPGGARPRRRRSGNGSDYEDNAYHLSEGKRLYTWFNCNGCHAKGGGGSGPPLMDDRWIYGARHREHRRRPSARAVRTACPRSGARCPTTRSGSSPPMCAP